MRLLPLLTVLGAIISLASPAKILTISFFSSKSHKITYYSLIEELASRGHEITVVTPVPAGKVTKNIKEILVPDLMKDMEKDFNVFEMKERGESINPFLMVKLFKPACEGAYDMPEVKGLLKEEFDLIFFQPMFNDCVLGLIHLLKAPVVLFSPVSAPAMLVTHLGGHMPPSFVGNVFLGYSDEMTFTERFLNFGMNIFMEGILRLYYRPYVESIYRGKLGQDLPGVPEILGNASLVLSNGHFALARPKPFLPDVIDVGGIHSRPAKPLPKDLEDFISRGGSNGFILFSMGSAAKASQMSPSKRKMFLSVFSKLKQQVIWKWDTGVMDEPLPKNVKLGKWLPQQDLLGHKNIKMFITHCGGGSTEEAIYHGVPLLGIPMFGDQNLNAKQAQNLGILKLLEWNDLTEADLLDGINEVINNPKYQENVKGLSAVFKDQVNSPMERGVYWVEYVIRHKGAVHLRSAARNLNTIQYHSIDVIAAYLGIIGVGGYLIFAMLRGILRLVCRCGGTNKNVKKAKKQ